MLSLTITSFTVMLFVIMNVLLIGSGGREHAIARQLAKSPGLKKLFIAPGNAGTADVGQNIPVSDSDIPALLEVALKNKIDLTIVGPEGPLVKGVVDEFEKKGLAIVGPSKKASQLEGSKKWAKYLMKKYGIPTAAFETFHEFQTALNYVKKTNQYPIVIKADGLAAGKGVTIASSLAEAKQALEECFIHNKFGTAGHEVVIEAFLQGQEASIFAFTDGKTIIQTPAAQDHKAIYDGDKGPNTGGMGAYSPAPIVTKEVEQKVSDLILRPLVNAFRQEGIPYKGVIFAGLMIHEGNPYVIEFNVRLGDPETQVIVPRLKTELLDIFAAIPAGTLSTVKPQWDSRAAVCVVLAAEGYPGDYAKGIEITSLPSSAEDAHIIHAGTKRDDKGVLRTNGGRVLGAVSLDTNLETAIRNAYALADQVQFKSKYYRRDIGAKALKNSQGAPPL